MDDNAVGLHKRCGPTAFFVIFAKKSGARLSNCYIAQIVGGGGIIKSVKTTKNVKKKGDHKVDFLKLSVVPAATIFLTELMR